MQKEKGEREVKKRDSPQAQDHQEKWGERLMNLPCTWIERKKKGLASWPQDNYEILLEKKIKGGKRDLLSVQW